jgi:hypothetical protein
MRAQRFEQQVAKTPSSNAIGAQLRRGNSLFFLLGYVSYTFPVGVHTRIARRIVSTKGSQLRCQSLLE